MGINTVQWRASIGLFNVSKFSNPPAPTVDQSDELLWVVYTIILTFLFMLTIVGLLITCPITLLVLVCMLGTLFTQWALMLLLGAIVKVTMCTFKFWSSPSCLLCMVILPMTVSVFVPNLVFLLCSILNPSTTIHYLLLLCGDVHQNPGPVSGTGISIWYSNVNSLSAEHGQRFEEGSLRKHPNCRFM